MTAAGKDGAPVEPPVGGPVRPKDAASLVILRRAGAGHEVLMGRRASRHRFMPNLYVFPGGRRDPADSRVAVDSELGHEVAAKLEAKWSPRISRGLAVTAARETHEETGLLFGRLVDGELRPALAGFDYIARAITPPHYPMRFHARFFLADAGDAAGDARDSRELQDLRWLAISAALEMKIADVTEFVLGEVQRRLDGWRAPGIPFFHYHRRRSRVRYE